jgi:hypothetical protein
MPAVLSTFWYLISGGIVLLLPGLTWQTWFHDDSKDLFENLADAIGVSLAITALFALWAFLIGWKFSGIALIIIYTLLGFIALVGMVYRTNEKPTSSGLESSNHTCTPTRPKYFAIILLVAFGILIVWRFFQIRNLVLPAWVDSVHHTLVVRAIIENGGLIGNLEPYMSVPFYYHFAFHVITASFSFWSRLEPAQAVLFFGQILNAVIAISVYRLSIALWKDWRRAVLAAGLTGFVLQMPAYYASWGRYTLLAGLVLLPLAMAEALDIVHNGATKPRLTKMVLFTGGLLLAHYFAALLLAIFLLFLGIQVLIQDIQARRFIWQSRWLPLIGATTGGVLISVAWIYRTFTYVSAGVNVGFSLSSQDIEARYFSNYLTYLWRIAGPTHNLVLLFLAIIGVLLALWRRKTRPFGFWTLTLGLMSIPWGLYLQPFRPDHAVIVLFLPASLLVSDLFFSLIGRLGSGWSSRLVQVALSSGLASLVFWGIWITSSIINPSTVLANQADLQAIRWIDDNTPPGARFFINVTYWQAGNYRGVDGGWWITPITGRETLLPAALYAAGSQSYIKQVNQLAAKASQLQTCTPDFWEVIQSDRLTYIYVKENDGSLQAAHLIGCPSLKLVFKENGVSIFQVTK